MSKHEWTKFWYEESVEMTPEEAIRAFREVHPDAARWWGIDTAAPETEPRIRGMQSKIAKQSHRIRQLTLALEQERNRDAVAARLRIECETLRSQRDRLRASKDTWVSLWQRTLGERDQLQDEVETWKGLYRRAINEANGLTNYVEDRPGLYSAEKRLTKIQEDARAALKETK